MVPFLFSTRINWYEIIQFEKKTEKKQTKKAKKKKKDIKNENKSKKELCILLYTIAGHFRPINNSF